MKQIKEREVKQGHIIIMNRFENNYFYKGCVILLFMCSMSGHRLVSSTNNTYFYGATKFAVTALTEGIRRELRSMESPIKVTVRIFSMANCTSYILLVAHALMHDDLIEHMVDMNTCTSS